MPRPPPATGALSGGGDNIFKTLVHKIKALELNQSLFDRYMAETNARYVSTFRTLESGLAQMEACHENASVALHALLNRVAALEARAREEDDAADRRAERAAAAAAAGMRLQLVALRHEAWRARACDAVAAAALAVLAAAHVGSKRRQQ
jgi:hypothetical protein